jgi:hypothetical protein
VTLAALARQGLWQLLPMARRLANEQTDFTVVDDLVALVTT